MEITEILERFCDPGRRNHNCSAPYHYGDHTYACNGHMAIRVPYVDYPYKTNSEMEALKAFFPADPTSLEYLDIDIASIHSFGSLKIKLTCPKCHGGQCAVIICPECDGSGTAEASNAYSDYEVDCATCDGEGEVICDNCNGAGEILNEETIEVGGVLFKKRYIKIIFDLPDLHLALNGADSTSKNGQPAYFIFEGGEGILMPCSE